MSHVSKLAEALRTANETGLASIGRQIAETSMIGGSVEHLVRDAAVRRQIEQQSADKATQFAALVRQIGDAVNAGNPIETLVAKLRELRRRECSGK